MQTFNGWALMNSLRFFSIVNDPKPSVTYYKYNANATENGIEHSFRTIKLQTQGVDFLDILN
jgi:hypothetical protein